MAPVRSTPCRNRCDLRHPKGSSARVTKPSGRGRPQHKKSIPETLDYQDFIRDDNLFPVEDSSDTLDVSDDDTILETAEAPDIEENEQQLHHVEQEAELSGVTMELDDISRLSSFTPEPPRVRYGGKMVQLPELQQFHHVEHDVGLSDGSTEIEDISELSSISPEPSHMQETTPYGEIVQLPDLKQSPEILTQSQESQGINDGESVTDQRGMLAKLGVDASEFNLQAPLVRGDVDISREGNEFNWDTLDTDAVLMGHHLGTIKKLEQEYRTLPLDLDWYVEAQVPQNLGYYLLKKQQLLRQMKRHVESLAECLDGRLETALLQEDEAVFLTERLRREVSSSLLLYDIL